MKDYDILHLTTVHQRTDVRIVLKEVISVIESGQWNVVLVVADGYGNSIDDISSLVIEDIGRARCGRMGRMVIGSWQAFRRIRMLKPRLIHFHDPELILLGLVLKCFGYKVVYDVHEDVPYQIMDKHWIPSILRYPIAFVMEIVESVGARVFDRIVIAEPKVAERFPSRKTVVVQNFPRMEEFTTPNSVPHLERPSTFAYVGAITLGRGVREIVQAVSMMPTQIKCRLELAGLFQQATVQDETEQMPGWSKVRFHGWSSRIEVANILGNVRAGLVVLHPHKNYIDSFPTKMFEYMAMGLPVIASDFRQWRRIMSDVNCGLFVDPKNPESIAKAMQWILDHPQEAEAMGQRGRKAVAEVYNWKSESIKLANLYGSLLGD